MIFLGIKVIIFKSVFKWLIEFFEEEKKRREFGFLFFFYKINFWEFLFIGYL